MFSFLGLSSNYPALAADWLTCCQGTAARLETSKRNNNLTSDRTCSGDQGTD